MGLYSANIKIDGIICGLVMRGLQNGQYIIVFEREHASLEQIEGINWSNPTVEGDTPLPIGYGYDIVNIEYHMNTQSYHVTIQTARQYLGDVTGYQAHISELEQKIETQNQTIQELESVGSITTTPDILEETLDAPEETLNES